MENKKKDLPNPVIRLGLACNEKCLFCNLPPECGEISGESYAKARILEAPKGCCVSISGGEPTLYPFLPEIISMAKQRGISTELQTNAVLLSDPEKTKMLKKAGLDFAFVSLHSHIALVHDFLTGLKGSWEKGISGIHNLLSAGIFVSVNAVITSANYNKIDDFAVFLRKRLGVRQLSLSVAQPRQRMLKNKALLPDYSVLDIPVREAISAAREEGLRLINPICGLPMCVGGWENCLELCTEYAQGCSGEPFCNGKIHTPKCENCMAKKYCGGVWQEYYELRGDSALKPFKRFPLD